MRVRELGRMSGPPVLLLHDSPFPAAHLEYLAANLSTTRRVLLPDLAGYGGSALLDVSIASAQDALEALVYDDEIVHVVGIGLGGYRALRLALSLRARCGRVVTVGGFAGLSDDLRRRYTAWADIARVGGDLCDVIIDRALPPAQRDGSLAFVERLRTWVHEIRPTTLIAELCAMSRIEDLRPSLPMMKARVLAIHGSEDGLIPPIRSTEIATCSHAEIEIVPCGHLPLEELPDHVIPRIRRFLSW